MSFRDIVEQRRAINFFDPDRDVSGEVLDEMIELAAKSPSSFNLQPWNLIVVREQAEKEALKALAWDQPKVVEAPVNLILLADKNGWQEGHPTVEKNWQQMLDSGSMQPEQRDWFLNAAESLYNWNSDANLAFAAKNAGFFGMSLMYAATSLGLESHHFVVIYTGLFGLIHGLETVIETAELLMNLEDIRFLFETIGYIDAALSVASYRKTTTWSRPSAPNLASSARSRFGSPS